MLKDTFGLFLILGGVVSSPARPNEAIRIVGGHDASINDIPYQVSLLRYGSHSCGGTLIDNQHILTAAHCIVNTNVSALTIRMGATTPYNGGNLVRVIDSVWHPEFTFAKMDCDIAIAQLEKPVEFNSNQTAIKLMSKGEDIRVGVAMNVSGFGLVKEGGSLARSLQLVTVPTISESACKAAYEPLYSITKSMLCAGVSSGGKDACQGDSGGPLVHNNTLVGIVSWGIGCGRWNYPGVYTKVSHFRDWIDENMAYLRSKTILRGSVFD